jgi:hypothetical protein
MTPESQSRCSLAYNDLVNRFPRQRMSKQQSKHCWAIMMETVFSVGSAPRLYNEDHRPAENNNCGSFLRRQSKMTDKKWQRVNWQLQECGYEKISRALQLQWDWYNHCAEIRCKDTTPSVMIAVTENISHSTAKMWRSTMMQSFSCNSQIKCSRTHVHMDIFSYSGMRNSCLKFVHTFQLHPV